MNNEFKIYKIKNDSFWKETCGDYLLVYTRTLNEQEYATVVGKEQIENYRVALTTKDVRLMVWHITNLKSAYSPCE